MLGMTLTACMALVYTNFINRSSERIAAKRAWKEKL